MDGYAEKFFMRHVLAMVARSKLHLRLVSADHTRVSKARPLNNLLKQTEHPPQKNVCVANLKQVSFGLGVQKGVLVVGPVRDGVAEHEQRGVVFEHPEARLPLPQQNGAR